MSAKELIQQVIAMTPQEKDSFLGMLRDLEHEPETRSRPRNGQKWPDFSQRLQEIYGDKIVPDSQLLIDEGRSR